MWRYHDRRYIHMYSIDQDTIAPKVCHSDLTKQLVDGLLCNQFIKIAKEAAEVPEKRHEHVCCYRAFEMLISISVFL